MVDAALFSSNTIYWSTPQWLYDALDKEFGFTLDVCATPENSKCQRFFTEDDDALCMDWVGGGNVCWMNPPYGSAISSFMQKAHESANSGATVVCLVPARTDTAWWHKYAMKHEIRFIRGRLKFGGAKNSAPFPSAIIVMRPPAFQISAFGT